MSEVSGDPPVEVSSTEPVDTGAAPPVATMGAMRGGHDPSELGRRRWAMAKSPDPKERAIAALIRIGNSALRAKRRIEAAGGNFPKGWFADASAPWRALLDGGIKLDAAKFGREELAEAKRLLATVRRERRRA